MRERPGLLFDDLTRSIIGAFYDAYNEMGFGLLESVYGAALDEELRRRGHHVEREFWVDVFYKGTAIARQRIDRIVDRQVVLEIKATEQLPPFAKRQLLTYLRVTRLEVGLILHFGPTPEFYRMVSSNWPRPGY
jgi:GxxExxY protein